MKTFRRATLGSRPVKAAKEIEGSLEGEEVW